MSGYLCNRSSVRSNQSNRSPFTYLTNNSGSSLLRDACCLDSMLCRNSCVKIQEISSFRTTQTLMSQSKSLRTHLFSSVMFDENITWSPWPVSTQFCFIHCNPRCSYQSDPWVYLPNWPVQTELQEFFFDCSKLHLNIFTTNKHQKPTLTLDTLLIKWESKRLTKGTGPGCVDTAVLSQVLCRRPGGLPEDTRDVWLSLFIVLLSKHIFHQCQQRRHHPQHHLRVWRNTVTVGNRQPGWWGRLNNSQTELHFIAKQCGWGCIFFTGAPKVCVYVVLLLPGTVNHNAVRQALTLSPLWLIRLT